jgi:hypothetical protein
MYTNTHIPEKIHMKTIRFTMLMSLILSILVIASCKPVNIFSPLVNPSKMGNDAKMDAGYNALADGDYDTAIDYFSDVIKGSSGEQLTDAYIGRAAAYLNKGAPNLQDAVADLISGDLQFDSPGDVITNIKGTNDYSDFFDNVSNAADDYGSAMDNAGTGMDQGILVEAYQANMMAATGVGATTISLYDPAYPSYSESEVDDILAGGGAHVYDVDTWDDTNPANNGLRQHVFGKPEDAQMYGYLQNAFDALNALQSNPPLDMDIAGLKSNINAWVTNGLNRPPLV